MLTTGAPGLAGASPHPGLATPGGMISYGMPPVSINSSAALLAANAGGLATNPALSAMFAQQPQQQSLPPGMTGLPSMAGVPTLGGVPSVRPQMQAGPYGLQPLLYWYPSPPVSPQNGAYYVQQTQPSAVVMKGVHFNAQVQDVLAFLEGIYEVSAFMRLVHL